MSHFSVLVVGEDVDKQLAPYHEYECTGLNDEYVVDVDITDEVLEDAARLGSLDGGMDYHGLEDKLVTNEEEVDRDGTHLYGYAVVVDGKLVKAVKRTNPNAKWDYYRVGWGAEGAFLLKHGGRADSALKGQVDIAGMRDAVERRAEELWDACEAALRAAGASPTWRSWGECVGASPSDLDATYEAYDAQAPVQVLRKLFKEKNLWRENIDRFLLPRAEYLQTARDTACSCFAFVRNGEWSARGTMEWFGDVCGEGLNWWARFAQLLDSVPDSERITIVDCHI